jgi:DNA-directed RNA polymerase specialized sigma24 family protein
MAHYFCEEEGLRLFDRWKKTGDIQAADQLLRLCLPLVNQLISTWQTTIFAPREEIVNDTLIHLHRALQGYFDPGRGRLYSFTTRVVQTSLINVVRGAKERASRLCLVGDDELDQLSVNGVQHAHNVADVHFRIRQIKSIISCPNEQIAQRWLVENLLTSAFIFRRYEAATGLEIVFGLSPERSRMIFDLTVLSCRREILNGYGFNLTIPGRLVGTRGRALQRFKEGLSDAEFGRLKVLMRNLAPRLVFEKARLTPREALYGSAREQPLFST